jgi:hypothetical protein
MSEEVPRRPKSLPAESDLSQILSHGPAYCAAYGRPLGALLMLFAITKARRGPIGIAAAATFVMTFFYNVFLK